MALLEVASISKSFTGVPVLQDVSFSVAKGETVCLLGPSGCGKTTLLRVIAGLEVSDSGYIAFGGMRLDDVPVHRRGFGLMFQDYALFPHKDVASNVAFGMRMLDQSQSHIDARVSEMLAWVGLEGYAQRSVYDLSGGEQQRVALARSLAPDPDLLMLDEPLGSLDRALREELMDDLRAILRRVGVTVLYVTHDQEEAFSVADRVIIMDRGRLVQQGTPQMVYRHPASPWVARFLGLTNLIPGRIVNLAPLQADTDLGVLAVGDEAERVAVGQHVTLLVRPEAARLATGRLPGRPGQWDEGGTRVEFTVREYFFRGGHYRLVVDHDAGLRLSFELVSGSQEPGQPGEPVALTLRPEAICLLVGERNDGSQ
jgi:ABC-type Fe3+/spermidine/putrescine transport system ATPase subunit